VDLKKIKIYVAQSFFFSFLIISFFKILSFQNFNKKNEKFATKKRPLAAGKPKTRPSNPNT